jgi:hypothetical protein
MNTQTNNTQTVGTLAIGQVINFYRSTTADNSNYVVLGQFSDMFGDWTKIMKISKHNKAVSEYWQEQIAQHTQLGNLWTIVKTN